MSIPKSYRTYADFEREEIRPSFKVGFSMEDMVEEATFETDTVDWDRDPFELEEDLGAGTLSTPAAGSREACAGSSRQASRRFCDVRSGQFRSQMRLREHPRP